MYGMFFDTYDTPVYRPPSEAASFILRVTRGCAHNNCTYCNMYRGVRFEKLSDEQIMRQIELARATDAEGVRRVFLADGDALVLPTGRLLKILAVLKEYFPNLERVASYAAPGDILRKSVEELTSLRKAGLTLLYYGMESGDSQTLKEIRKGVNGEQSIEVGKRAIAAGMQLSIMAISGQRDSAAAMRYTEMRMAKITLEMLRDIDKDTVDFMPNYDGSLTEPLVLPSRIPNLLVNGSYGIAVGMEPNVPPHNLAEVVDGLCAMIDNPEITIEELMKYIKGPDFPTAAIIQGHKGIEDTYRTGRGSITVRARVDIEEMERGKNRIIVTELPYQVNKARLVEMIADLSRQKVIDGITALRDESDRSGMRIVIELRSDVNPQIMLNIYLHRT